MKKIQLAVLLITTLITSAAVRAQNAEASQTTSVNSRGKFRLAVSGGYSYQTASTKNIESSLLKDYAKTLKSGSSLTVDAGLYINPNWSCNLRYSGHYSKGRLNDVFVEYDNGDKKYGYLSDNITITFLGAMFIGSSTSKDYKHQLYYGSGLGYVGYKNETVVIAEHSNLKGSTLGFALDLGYEYFIDTALSIGVQTSLFTGTLGKVENGTETKELDDKNRIGLGRFDVMAGLRLYL